jgi:transposase-like protein
MTLRKVLSVEMIAKEKKKQYSALQRGQLLAAYKNSEIPKKQWCEEHGVAVSTLHKWLSCDKNQTGTQITQDWVPVTALPQTKNKMLLLQAGKFSITVEKSTDMELLSSVLSMLLPLC